MDSLTASYITDDANETRPATINRAKAQRCLPAGFELPGGVTSALQGRPAGENQLRAGFSTGVSISHAPPLPPGAGKQVFTLRNQFLSGLGPPASGRTHVHELDELARPGRAHASPRSSKNTDRITSYAL